MIKNWLLGCLLLLMTSGLSQAALLIKKGVPASFNAKAIQGATYQWTFPGGETRSGAAVRHTFKEGGEQQVKLTVTRGGSSNSTIKNVFVQHDEKPTAIPKVTAGGRTFEGGLIKIERGDSIQFDSASVDEEGKDENIITSWTLNGRTYSSSEMQYLFDEPGLYSIKMVAAKRGQPSLRDEKFFQIEVVNQKPVITAVNFSQDGKLGAQRVKVSATAEDPDGEIKQYRFEVLEYGQTRVAQVSDISQTTFNLAQFPGAHEYSFRVTVLDEHNAQTRSTTTETLQVNNIVENTSPTLSLIPTPGNLGKVGTVFLLTARASDPDGDFLRYEWSLPGGERRFTSSISYQFTQPGVHPITVKVTDGIVVVEETIEINVIGLPASQENRAPEVKIRGVLPSTAGDTSTIFSFYADVKDLDQDQVKTYWELGNGAKMTLENIAYQFREPGTYTVKVVASDGLLQAADSVDITVVEPGVVVPENEAENDVLALEESLEADLAEVAATATEEYNPLEVPEVQISSANLVVREYNPFSPTLRTILQQEYDDRKVKLTRASETEKADLAAEMQEIERKIEQLGVNAFFVRGEFTEGRVVELIDQRDIKISAFKKEYNPAKREAIQEEILQLSREIKNVQFGISDYWLIEDILKEAQSSREGVLSATEDTEERRILLEEIHIIKQELSKLRNNPFLARTPEVRALLVDLQSEKEGDLDAASSQRDQVELGGQIQQIKDQIALIDGDPDDEEALAAFQFANLVGTPNTRFFFYGKAPEQFKRALFFEWDLGNGIRRPGQNISIRYRTPGFYRVTLNVSDGLTTVTDSLTIKVVEDE